MSRPQRGNEASPPDTPEHEPQFADEDFVGSDLPGRLLESLPPWGSEIAAVVLVVFGIVSFLSLFDVSSDATVSRAWSNTLSGAFGRGSLLIAIGITGLGVLILLPRLGIYPRLPARRVLALQFAFLALLPILHLSASDGELRAVVRTGHGGGIVGWGLSVVIAGLFSSAFALFFYTVLFFICVGALFGLGNSHVIRFLQQTSKQVRSRGQTIAPDTSGQGAAQPQSQPVRTRVRVSREQRKLNIVRIRPNPANLPPSRRIPVPANSPGPALPAPKRPASVVSDRPQPTVVPLRRNEAPAPAKLRRSEVRLVERPDGRVRRYFTFDHNAEKRLVAERSDQLPPLELLSDVALLPPDAEEINRNIVLLENTLLEFDIDIEVVDVQVGPTITRYAIQPFRENPEEKGSAVFSRTRVKRIVALTKDLALALAARRLRMETPVPGKTYLGIEVPNHKAAVVALRPVIENEYFYRQLLRSKSPLLIPLGRDVAGQPVAVDIGEMPHLLIAGATGTGKSVAIGAIATSLLLNNTPVTLRLVMLDPKMVELSRFNGIPHLVGPVETRLERIIEVLRWCTREMDRRYKLLETAGARNIEAFNARPARRRDGSCLPWIVILIDEIGDLMQAHPEETERSLTRLAQMARAVGMHLIIATQRPSVDVLTGLIKANFPTRMAFAVASGVDSRVILDTVGAETLLGKGDMLYLASDAAGPQRIQGCLVHEEEVRSVVDFWRQRAKQGTREGAALEEAPWEQGMRRRQLLSETDPLLEQAVRVVLEEGEASASLLQRRMGLGYPRAARIIDLLHELHIIGPPEAGGRGRRVLYQPGEDPIGDELQRRAT